MDGIKSETYGNQRFFAFFFNVCAKIRIPAGSHLMYVPKPGHNRVEGRNFRPDIDGGSWNIPLRGLSGVLKYLARRQPEPCPPL